MKLDFNFIKEKSLEGEALQGEVSYILKCQKCNYSELLPFTKPLTSLPNCPQCETTLKLVGLDLSLLPFTWIPDFISLAGSTLYERENDRDANDIDIIVRAIEIDGCYWIKLDSALRLKIDRMLKARLGEDKVTQWISSPYGPSWRYLPLFHLTLSPTKDIKFREVGENEFAEEFYKIQQPFSIFGSIASVCKNIDAVLPPHKLYVEAFCGPAHYLYKKEPSESEAIADLDPQITFLHMFIKNMTDADLLYLKQRNWIMKKERWLKIKDELKDETILKNMSDRERFYKWMYCLKGSKGTGVATYFQRPYENRRALPRLEKVFKEARERLKGVHILTQDYKKTISQFDGKDTLFYLDPPFPESSKYYRVCDIDYTELKDVCKSIKGKFILLISYSAETKNLYKGFEQRKVEFKRPFHFIAPHVSTKRYQLVISNFSLKNWDNIEIKKEEGVIDRSDRGLSITSGLGKSGLNKLEDALTYTPPPLPLSDEKLAQLRDDFRITAGWYATFKETEGRGIKFTEDEIIGVATKILKSLLDDKRTEFHSEEWKQHSRELYLKAFQKLIKSGVYLVPPHGELIYKGKKRVIVKSEKYDFLTQFNILVSDKLAFGYIRCSEPLKVPIDAFANSFNEHRITEREREKWWPGVKGFYFYTIRDFIPFDKPQSVRLPPGIQVSIKEVEFMKNTTFDKQIELKKLDEEQHLVYGIVYEPNITDTQGDYMASDEIEKAAHKFLTDYRQLSYMHQIPETGAELVESYIVPSNTIIGKEQVKRGSWVIVVKILRDDLWQEIRDGKIQGFSFEGSADVE